MGFYKNIMYSSHADKNIITWDVDDCIQITRDDVEFSEIVHCFVVFNGRVFVGQGGSVFVKLL
jgi:hypothetical protein